MSAVTQHYDTLLAQHYSWMVGAPFEAKVAEQQALLEQLGVPGRAGLAVDLGCGPGFQSVALARLGFSPILAVDSCQALLNELAGHTGDLPIEAVCADLRGLKQLVAPGTAAAVVCMGDTLTHLESRSDVSRLLADSHAVLAPGGTLVLTFRDLSVELKGLDRFLPVRSDGDRIMTCVLDYERDSVVVNDLVYVREGGSWSLHKSNYRKLRVGVEDLSRELRELGFAVRSSEVAGRLQALTATK
jgi:SAM-dependent methyltransferase